MNVRAVSRDELDGIMKQATDMGLWLTYENIKIRLGDKAVLGWYAERDVCAICFRGELIYVERT